MVGDKISRTTSPDYIFDTPIPSRREISEILPLPSRVKLEAENARLRKELLYRYQNYLE